MSKTAAWWEKSALERHSYFYPHHEDSSGSPVKGHAKAAEAGIAKVFRRLYHNPDGYQRPNEFDFITLLRMHRREPAGVRSDLPRAARRAAEPGMEVRAGGAGMAGEAGTSLVDRLGLGIRD